MNLKYAISAAAFYAALQPITYAENPASATETPSVPSEVQDAGTGKKPGEKPPEQKGAPLPLLTIDGVGGVVITPIAYLVNPGPEGTEIGLPTFGATYINARQKNVESFGVAETLFGRLELGYNASRFGTGSLQTDVLKYAGADIERNDVWLHTLNARFAAVRGNDFGSEYVPTSHWGYTRNTTTGSPK